jgi:hypothetical protein
MIDLQMNVDQPTRTHDLSGREALKGRVKQRAYAALLRYRINPVTSIFNITGKMRKINENAAFYRLHALYG